MVVGHLDVVGVAVDEAEANPPLVVDCDRVLSLSVGAEFVEPVARRNPEIVEAIRQVDVLELSPGSPENLRRQSPRPTRREKGLRVPIREGLDHPPTVIRHVTRVKQGSALETLDRASAQGTCPTTRPGGPSAPRRGVSISWRRSKIRFHREARY